jgi:hypothetical protein
MEKIDFSTTSTARPDILAQTYESFNTRLAGIKLADCKLFLNVDLPQSDGPFDVQKTILVAKKYFGEVVVNTTAKPNFAQAVKNCFSSTAADLLFHLEDDWELLEEVNIEQLHEILMSRPSLGCVNLRAYAHFTNTYACLSPALWRAEAARDISSKLNDHDNPEMQMHNRTAANKVKRPMTYRSTHFPDRVVLKDLGRSWMAQNRIVKDNGDKFIDWRPAAVKPL